MVHDGYSFEDDETTARRLAEWVFIESVTELRHRVRPEATAYDHLGISAILRRTLTDRHPVLPKVQARLNLPAPVFEYTPKGIFSPFGDDGPPLTFEVGPLDSSPPTHATGLEQFLAARAGSVHGAAVTVRQVIRHFAHAHGGVHLGAPENDFERAVQRAASIMPWGGWTVGLVSLGRIAIRAFDPLVLALRSNPYPPPKEAEGAEGTSLKI